MTTDRGWLSSVRARVATAGGLVIFLVLAGTGAGHAVWTATAPVAVSVTPASLGISETGVSVLNHQYKFAGAATNSSTVLTAPAIAVQNTGQAPLRYSLQLSAPNATLPSTLLQLSTWTSTTSACGATVPTGATTTTLAGYIAAPLALPEVAAGATYYLCAATKLLTTVAQSQGLATTLVFDITGRVGANWTTTATGSATQTVYRIARPPTLTCTTHDLLTLGSYVTLAWTYPTTATGTSVSITGNGIAGTLYSGSATTANFALAAGVLPTRIAAGAVTTLTLVVAETQYGTRSEPVTVAVRATGGLGLAPGIACA